MPVERMPTMPAPLPRRAALALILAAPLAACGGVSSRARYSPAVFDPPLHPNETAELRALIEHYADHYDVPVALVHRVVARESRHNPAARNGPYYGLMQILPDTARTMGYRGAPAGLMDPDTNLRYGVRYLRGAWLLSDGSFDRAVMWYSRGYYYEARRRGMLRETGLRT